MKYTNPKIVSSYRENNLGKTLYKLVMELKPKRIIEFGTLHGYSAVAMAMALQELGEGHLISYDLWDNYKFTHGVKVLVEEHIKELGLDALITLEEGDLNNWVPEPCDLIHVDISNDGEKLKRIEEKCRGTGAVVIFEGGSPERDRIHWMLKYNRMPMNSCGVRYDVIDEKFPSLSKLI